MGAIYESKAIPGLKIRVTSLKDKMPKCARCLKYCEDVGAHDIPAYMDVCVRCAKVLTELKYGPGTIEDECP